MSAIGPGDNVECVDADDATGLVLGAIYRVRSIEITIHRLHPGVVVLIPEGFPNQGQRTPWSGLRFAGYRLGRFRPVHRPTTTFMTALMQPAPKEPVPA